jgi:hypothetical protein
VAVEGVGIEADLGVEAQKLLIAGDDQRIDLKERHVLGHEGLVEF